MKAHLRVFTLLLALLVSAHTLAAQEFDLDATLESSSGLLTIQYPADWTGDEVGPAIFWFRTPNTDWIPNTALPPGGARISLFLPAQANFVQLPCPPRGGEAQLIAGREWLVAPNQQSSAPGAVATIYCTEFVDGWLTLTLHAAAGDQRRYDALVRAMIGTLTYEPVTNPTATPTPTISPTPLPTATATATPTPLPAAQTFTAEDTGFAIQYPAGWAADNGPEAGRYIIASSDGALQRALNGEDLQEADLVIQVVAPPPAGESDPAAVLNTALEAVITRASIEIRLYDRMDYPAFLLRFIGATDTGRIPRNLRVILADIGGRPTLFIVNSYRPFNEWEAQAAAILNTAAYR